MWLKLDAAFYGHPKIMLAGRDARDLYGAGLCWSAFYMTDGFLPVSCLARLGADAAGGTEPIDVDAAVQRLLANGLWEKASGGYHIHDYLKHQNSRSKMRATAKQRAQAGAAGGDAKAKQNASNVSSKALAKPVANALAKTTPTPSKTASENVPDKDIELDYERGPAPLPPTPPAADPEARASSPRALRAIPKPHEVERAELEANPLYDPLVQLFGKPIARELVAWREDIDALDEMGACPEDIPPAAAAYAQVMGRDPTGRPILLTRSALVRHWHRCFGALGESGEFIGIEEHDPFEAPIVAWARRNGLYQEQTADAAP